MATTEFHHHPLDPYLRVERLPTTFCPGCPIGTVLSCYVRALKNAEIDPKNVVTISGIGCTGRVSGYLNTDGFHALHGRAIPFATGVVTSRPDLNVNIISGDGDLFAIGGNHFIHAARRNLDMNVICINNHIYGMTGGQTAPTTFIGAVTTTTPKPRGATLRPFNLVSLAMGAGAVYVSRYPFMLRRQLTNAITKVLKTEGFAFIEVIAPCPTVFGRRNKFNIPDIYDNLKTHSVPATQEELQNPRLAQIEWKPDIGYVRVPYGEFVRES
ncbi:MAG: thiamine pyrophosphate-dependent enzyme [Promethearchaeota archaeon]